MQRHNTFISDWHKL